MRLYLDDSCASQRLLQTLRRAGHDVEAPRNVNLIGRPDPVHLIHCIHTGRVILSSDHSDFEILHDLVRASGGRHPGILAIRKDNSPRDMTQPQIVKAIDNLTAAGVAIANEFIVLNHWR